MAKPIEPIPTFEGEAAKWLTQYLVTAQPDPAKQEQARQDAELVERYIKPRAPR